ncbi:hypothetical protein K438DRAFT_359629 [Mycena galopus ATCC 62051]|nr:hypothetical protein K438DRAFT_359629 [Mycena galopus ATCC 62051]
MLAIEPDSDVEETAGPVPVKVKCVRKKKKTALAETGTTVAVSTLSVPAPAPALPGPTSTVAAPAALASVVGDGGVSVPAGFDEAILDITSDGYFLGSGAWSMPGTSQFGDLDLGPTWNFNNEEEAGARPFVPPHLTLDFSLPLTSTALHAQLTPDLPELDARPMRRAIHCGANFDVDRHVGDNFDMERRPLSTLPSPSRSPSPRPEPPVVPRRLTLPSTLDGPWAPSAWFEASRRTIPERGPTISPVAHATDSAPHVPSVPGFASPPPPSLSPPSSTPAPSAIPGPTVPSTLPSPSRLVSPSNGETPAPSAIPGPTVPSTLPSPSRLVSPSNGGTPAPSTIPGPTVPSTSPSASRFASQSKGAAPASFAFFSSVIHKVSAPPTPSLESRPMPNAPPAQSMPNAPAVPGKKRRGRPHRQEGPAEASGVSGTAGDQVAEDVPDDVPPPPLPAQLNPPLPPPPPQTVGTPGSVAPLTGAAARAESARIQCEAQELRKVSAEMIRRSNAVMAMTAAASAEQSRKAAL